MKAKLYFQEIEMEKANLGATSSVPDLMGGLILQNNLEFHLNEEDEIYEGYGRCNSSYPYRQYVSYDRKLKKEMVKTAVLENEHLKAVFLPEYGGRLWSLYDKDKKRNLLYTNDVLRFSNLAVCNAWFSGGVEWNIGIIGHSPFTTAPLFAGELKTADGTSVLRMYEYERIRQVTYQMDFWLGENDRFLNARMRIKNHGEDVVPMYWWSNMAVPEYENGRIVVPAGRAFTFRDGGVYRVEIPQVAGKDVTKYGNIPSSVDYFFDIPLKAPKYIANVDEDGYGLLQMSTDRLQSRKLFSWGHKRGGDRWQKFLTRNGGKYTEIQAGLGKTQYGCIPMAPHTAWEWLERYGAVQLKDTQKTMPFEELRDNMTEEVQEMPEWQEMEATLQKTGTMAKTPAIVRQRGSGFGALAEKVRIKEGKNTFLEHLDFQSDDGDQEVWTRFLETGELELADVSKRPPMFPSEELFFQMLKNYVKTKSGEKNWYAWYQLGVYDFWKEKMEDAGEAFALSLENEENAWALHGLASVHTREGRKKQAVEAISRGICLQIADLSYVKEGFWLLDRNEAFSEIRKIYESLSTHLQEEGRIKLFYIRALANTGEREKAYSLIMENGGLDIADIREGELLLAQVWKEVTGEHQRELPEFLDFDAL